MGKSASSYKLCPIAACDHALHTATMRIVPPDEYSGAVTYLQGHGYSITAVDSLGSADAAAARTRVNGKDLTAEEVVSLAVEKGWELP